MNFFTQHIKDPECKKQGLSPEEANTIWEAILEICMLSSEQMNTLNSTQRRRIMKGNNGWSVQISIPDSNNTEQLKKILEKMNKSLCGTGVFVAHQNIKTECCFLTTKDKNPSGCFGCHCAERNNS